MKKRVFGLMAVAMLLLSACSEEKEIVSYPSDVTEEVAPTANVEVSVTEKDGEKFICYDVVDNKGSVAYKVDAVITGNTEGSYPVYEVAPVQLGDDYINNMKKAVFEPGSISVLMPLQVADIDYVNRRMQELKDRRDSYGSEDEVPPYINESIEELEELVASDAFDHHYTIAAPDEPKMISLKDYYSIEKNTDHDIEFCFFEGRIDGQIYRTDIIKALNYYTIRVYREDTHANRPERYVIYPSDAEIPEFSEDPQFTEEVAGELSQTWAHRFGLDYYSATDTFKSIILGDVDSSGKWRYTKVGYTSFHSLEMDGFSRPTSEYTDFYSDNMTDTRIYIDESSICDIDKFLSSIDNTSTDGYVMSTLETTPGSGAYKTGYESICVTVDKEGLVELDIENPHTVKSVKSTSADPLTFEQVDERARNYLKFLAENDKSGNYNTITITGIVLGMCRTTDEEGRMYMVPAWHYMARTNYSLVLARPIAVVNSIDGSIIDVRRGGEIVDF